MIIESIASRLIHSDVRVQVYRIGAIVTREVALSTLVESGVFAQCGHEHDCCGCWYASHACDFHIKDASTMVAIKYYRNV